MVPKKGEVFYSDNHFTLQSRDGMIEYANSRRGPIHGTQAWSLVAFGLCSLIGIAWGVVAGVVVSNTLGDTVLVATAFIATTLVVELLSWYPMMLVVENVNGVYRHGMHTTGMEDSLDNRALAQLVGADDAETQWQAESYMDTLVDLGARAKIYDSGRVYRAPADIVEALTMVREDYDELNRSGVSAD